MNENSSPSGTAGVETSPGFKNYAEAHKTLRSLLAPISEEVRSDYLNRLRASPSPRYIAFRLLALRAVGDMQTKLTPFISPLEEVLFAGSASLDLRQCDSAEAVGKAVSTRLASIQTKSDLKDFTAARLHLPILYGLIRVWDDPARFQTGLSALATAIDRASKPKNPRQSKASNNLEILARALTARVPERPLLGKALPEILKISQALVRQAETTTRENLELESKLGKANNDIESLRTRLENETEAKEELEAQITALRAEVLGLRAGLTQEKEHFEALKGHGAEERQRAVDDAVARLRSEVLRRVENIRLFADREQPNRQGILTLIAEIAEIFGDTDGGEA